MSLPPRASNLDPDHIARLAEAVGERLALRPGADPEAAIRTIGGVVHTYRRGLDPAPPDEASLHVRAASDFEIWLPDDVGSQRRRFLLAHELGHYFLHYPLVEPDAMSAAYVDVSAAEWEANAFAGALLVPRRPLRKAMADFDGILVDVAQAFGVSVELIRTRCEATGIAA